MLATSVTLMQQPLLTGAWLCSIAKQRVISDPKLTRCVIVGLVELDGPTVKRQFLRELLLVEGEQLRVKRGRLMHEVAVVHHARQPLVKANLRFLIERVHQRDQVAAQVRVGQDLAPLQVVVQDDALGQKQLSESFLSLGYLFHL